MSDHQKSAVVLLSGGLDSMVSAALAREAGYALHALTVDYNQRNRLELQSADRIAKALGACSHIVLPINLRAFGGRSEEHTSELQSLMRISYAVFCLKKKK